MQFKVQNFLLRIWAQFAYLFALHECYGIMFNLPIPIIGSRFYLRIDSKSRHQNKLLYAFSSTNFSNQTLGWTQFGSNILSFYLNSTVSCFFVANTNMSQHSYCFYETYHEQFIKYLGLRGHSITMWTRWGGRGSKNLCFCPCSRYKNCLRRRGGGCKKWQNYVHVDRCMKIECYFGKNFNLLCL